MKGRLKGALTPGEEDGRVPGKPRDETASPECAPCEDVDFPRQTTETTGLRITGEEGGKESREWAGVGGGGGQATVGEETSGFLSRDWRRDGGRALCSIW